MKNQLKPLYSALLAALVSSGACTATHAAAGAAPEVRTEIRTLIVDANGAAHETIGGDVMLAQGEPGPGKREVRIVTNGPQMDFSDLPDVNVIVSNAVSEAFAGGMTLSSGKTIKNAPYSAEVISEKVQTLPDGNQITKKTSTMAFRDSAGRTRQETRDSKGEVRSIRVFDAVDGTRYTISPAQKSATKIGIDKDLQKRIEEIREKAKRMARDGSAHIIERGVPGEEIIVKRVDIPDSEGKKGVREEVKVNVTRFNGEPKISVSDSGGMHYQAKGMDTRNMTLSELSPLSGLGNMFMDSKWSAKATTTSLGSKDIEGVRADGKSVSYSIPAGEIGNKNPIVVTTESWTSPELQVVMYSRHSDPRVGETIYRLANVKRTEQPITLFVVPDGYSVRDTPKIPPMPPIPPIPGVPGVPSVPKVK